MSTAGPADLCVFLVSIELLCVLCLTLDTGVIVLCIVPDCSNNHVVFV